MQGHRFSGLPAHLNFIKRRSCQQEHTESRILLFWLPAKWKLPIPGVTADDIMCCAAPEAVLCRCCLLLCPQHCVWSGGVGLQMHICGTGGRAEFGFFFPLSLSPPIVYAALIGFVKCLFLVSEVDRLNIEAHWWLAQRLSSFCYFIINNVIIGMDLQPLMACSVKL